jgi:hypothetical protein
MSNNLETRQMEWEKINESVNIKKKITIIIKHPTLTSTE